MSNFLTNVLKNVSTRIMLIIYLMLIIITAFFITYGYFNSLSLQEEKQYDKLKAIVTSTAVQIDGDKFQNLYNSNPEKDAITKFGTATDYDEIHNVLHQSQLNNGLESPMYTVVYDEPNDVFHYVVRSDDKIYFRHDYVKYPKELKDKMNVGGTLPKYVTENGTWLSAFYPIKNKNGEVVGVVEADIEFGQFSEIVNERYTREAIMALIVIIVFALVLIPYTRKILRHEDQQNEMILNQSSQLKEKNKDITDSITYAKRIQEAILPSNSQVFKQFPNHFILYKPKDIVAGDFYWVQDIGEYDLIAACDCTGHGVPGAMVSVVCNNALNRSVREFKLSSPSDILDKTTEIVQKSFELDGKAIKDGMDIALCAINRRTNKLFYSGAHNDLIIVRNNQIIKYKACRQPVGFFEHFKGFQCAEIQMEKGDQVYLSTDGYADQFGGEKGKKMKSVNFEKIILENAALSMEEQKDILVRRFEEWKSDYEQLDDICVIGFQV
ncbi:MAG: SpoIIE family protein phosphatase [Crocinitomicaceae bacterium]|nr:SpoIIE family protein phosphatase [Crocinitomicaceae bacterium]